ncbi:MAG: ABC-type transport auxiliary lipoprotein family protein [Alphaproteobacteria bacterium]|nr:ABC-type transport auxiliary lipoprotein family protein [Alphaproteobacteria bacterium]
MTRASSDITKAWPAVAVALTIGVVAGCIAPGQAQPPNLYDLSPKSTFSADLPNADWQLVVETPVAAAALNTPRIALKRGPAKVDYYDRAAWTDVAPQLVQTLIIESFENTKKIVSVGREDANLRSDYLLKPELREFQAEYKGGAAPVANVHINVKLVKMPQRTIIAGANFQYKAQASADSMNAIVEAFDDALGKVLKKVVEWAMRAPGTPPGQARTAQR